MAENNKKKSGWNRFLDILLRRAQEAAPPASTSVEQEPPSAEVEEAAASTWTRVEPPATEVEDAAAATAIPVEQGPPPFEVKKMNVADVQKMLAEGKSAELLEYSNQLITEKWNGEFFVEDGDKQLSSFNSYTTTNNFFKTMSIKQSFNLGSGAMVALFEAHASYPEGTLVRRQEKNRAMLAVVIASEPMGTRGSTGFCVPYAYDGGVGKNGESKPNPNRGFSFV